MSISQTKERRLLSPSEFDAVTQTHYPAICGLSGDQLRQSIRLMRDYRDKARDVSRHQRREVRGKAEPRGARPAGDNTGTLVKKQIFASALKRLNQERQRLDKSERRAGQSEIAARALELKRANRARHHPGSGRSAGGGMNPLPSDVRTVDTPPREIGRVSQLVKDAQARRDAR